MQRGLGGDKQSTNRDDADNARQELNIGQTSINKSDVASSELVVEVSKPVKALTLLRPLPDSASYTKPH